jgi:hypothetical protein
VRSDDDDPGRRARRAGAAVRRLAQARPWRRSPAARHRRPPDLRQGQGPADAEGLGERRLRACRGQAPAHPRSGGRCFYFSGRRQELERTRCGRAFFFKVGESPDVSYLLPERLGSGRYVLDLAAVDRAGNRSALARGSTRVVFTVR